jgi:hypothetical protein
MNHLINFCKAIFRDFQKNLANICGFMIFLLIVVLFLWGINELLYERVKFIIVNCFRLFFKTIFFIDVSFFALLLVAYLFKLMVFITKSIAHYLKSKWRNPKGTPLKEDPKSRYDLAREK